jgi:hypothetical protein
MVSNSWYHVCTPFLIEEYITVHRSHHLRWTILSSITLPGFLRIDHLIMIPFPPSVIRIPVSVAFALADPATKPKASFVSSNRDMKDKTIFEILEIVIQKAALRGLLVMLDMHFIEPQVTSELWVSG